MPIPPLDLRDEMQYDRSTLAYDGTRYMSDWPKADPVTDPSDSPSWRLIAEERARQLDRAHELIKILESRVAFLTGSSRPEKDKA